MNEIVEITALSKYAFLFSTGIFVLLGLATLLVIGLDLKKRLPDAEEIRARLKTWWIIAFLLIGSLMLGKTTGIIFLAFVSFLALKEYFSIIPTRRADRRVLFWAYLAIPIQYFWVSDAWFGVFIIFIPVYMFIFVPVRMLMLGQTDGFLKAVGTIQWGLMITVFGLSHLAYFLALPDIMDFKDGGARLILFVVFLTALNDVSQYVFGKKFGTLKITPKVSPNKTWAGFLGGVATTILVAWALAPWLTPFSPVFALGAGLIIAVAGFWGDITISAIKRDLGLKDTSSMLPGHGGILDRLDSLFFSAPLFFHYTYYFYY